MNLTSEQIKNYSKRILSARTHILLNNGFFGILLMHLKFGLEEGINTAATDGMKIVFDPKFLDGITDKELEFILMHELMHVVLKHPFRLNDDDLSNIACDIVVNSTIKHAMGDNDDSISVKNFGGVSMHLTPEGQEGYLYSVEEIYKILYTAIKKDGYDSVMNKIFGNEGDSSKDKNKNEDKTVDSHEKWGSVGKDVSDDWDKRIVDTCNVLKRQGQSASIPKIIEILYDELTSPQLDWRMLLNDFISEEINDYSFTPPDRRYQDSGFFLPDFNDVDASVNELLFMVDTSGSMSITEISEVYNEIKGAIDQFNGKLEGYLGFFDSVVVPPVKFSNIDELKVIKPRGGGGTSFYAVFEYIEEHQEDFPSLQCIIILTDGHSNYPKEEIAHGIPVLWIINNEKMTPPFGKVARIKSKS